MKQIGKYILSILLFAVMLFTSCGGVNSDAKKAAKLTNKSIEKTNELKLEEAEKLYKKSQEIIKKYESHRKSEKFNKLYQEYRDKGKINR
ncbi:MAG: hypothetical protein ACOYEG_10285 [Petrimonas sp.]|jgi:heterodisulfide reductase subunit C|nr:MAG: hypothetical protein BWZ00_01809 [Bacteroidetes bacterium ADurb.BinA174]